MSGINDLIVGLFKKKDTITIIELIIEESRMIIALIK